MELVEKMEQVKEICEHFLDDLEGKLDEVGVILSSAETLELNDTVYGIIEDSLSKL